MLKHANEHCHGEAVAYVLCVPEIRHESTHFRLEYVAFQPISSKLG